ncbi:hypothetical protein BCY86_07190 [Pajaroellobacter abortibovis]|uniref:Uncharacterized protein n=1 Tax=Pajaroellobacter abortibovis TaxID=1882918 RepID=A0A1L6MY41_9BACT|nr:hypothetical protein BCY86_07190 [Pajaroellobacter abortibovis]
MVSLIFQMGILIKIAGVLFVLLKYNIIDEYEDQIEKLRVIQEANPDIVFEIALECPQEFSEIAKRCLLKIPRIKRIRLEKSSILICFSWF